MALSRYVARYIVCISLFFSTSVLAVPISIFGTGLDGSGNTLSGGASDANFVVVETGLAAQVLTNSSSYFANDTNSQWIWQNANGSPTSVTRTFRTTFDLSGFDASSAIVSGFWGVDNIGVDIFINGTSTGNILPSVVTSNFTSLHAFTVNAGFQSGINTLDFVVLDVGSIAGFRASLTGNADLIAVPEAASTWLVLLGLAGVFYTRKKYK